MDRDEQELMDCIELSKKVNEEVEINKSKEYDCPICKGKAIGSKASNGHIHITCNSCDFVFMQ